MSAWVKSLLLFSIMLAVAALPAAAGKRLPSTCKRCSMRMDPAEKKFSVTVSEGIEPSVFDDIGCAIEWREGECATRTMAFDGNALVHDFNAGEPIPIEAAFFVHASGTQTPMGYDIAAFKNRADAEKLVRGKGAVLTFAQLCSTKLKQEPRH